MIDSFNPPYYVAHQNFKSSKNDPTGVLYDELLLNIFTYLTPKELGCCSHVNRRWHRISCDSKLPRNQESILTAPLEFLRRIRTNDPIISEWDKLEGKNLLKICGFQGKYVQFTTTKNLIREKHIRRKVNPRIRLEKFIVQVSKWKIYLHHFENNLYEVRGPDSSKYINVGDAHCETTSCYYIGTKIIGDVPVGDNHLVVATNFGAIQLWDLLSGKLEKYFDFQTEFRKQELEFKRAHYLQGHVILYGRDHKTRTKEKVIKVLCLESGRIVPNNILERLEEFGYYYSYGAFVGDRIVFDDENRFIAAFSFREGGMIDIDWSAEVLRTKGNPYESIRTKVCNQYWVAVRGWGWKSRNKRKDIEELNIYESKTGNLVGRIKTRCDMKPVFLYHNFLCFRDDNPPHLAIYILPSMEKYTLKMPHKKWGKRPYLIRDMAMNDHRIVLMQTHKGNFRIVTFTV
ncbi:MAG: hypothetical protein K940chlam3_01727 [Chlamydiae bacterium]|nr:hypothetical protein [Chlamydiota bacterium]